MKIAVSACLMGENCKYNGGNNLNARVIDFIGDKEYIDGGIANNIPADMLVSKGIKDIIAVDVGVWSPSFLILVQKVTEHIIPILLHIGHLVERDV